MKCLSVSCHVPTLLHRRTNGRGCTLVVHYWADLQLVLGFCCYGKMNVSIQPDTLQMHIAPNTKCQRVLVFTLWLVYRFLQHNTTQHIHSNNQLSEHSCNTEMEGKTHTRIKSMSKGLTKQHTNNKITLCYMQEMIVQQSIMYTRSHRITVRHGRDRRKAIMTMVMVVIIDDNWKSKHSPELNPIRASVFGRCAFTVLRSTCS